MKKREIEERLLSEAEDYVFDDREAIRRRAVIEKRPSGGGWFRIFKIAAPIAAALILAVALTLAFTLPRPSGGGGEKPIRFASVVRVDVNPSVKFTIDNAGLVINQTALNKDAATMLYNKDFTGREIGDAAAEIVALCVRYGYLNDDPARTVSLKVISDDEKFESDFLASIGAKIAETLSVSAASVALDKGGREEIVKFLTENFGIERKRLEKLSADDLEDLLEDLLEDDEEDDLFEFEEEISENLMTFLSECIAEADPIIAMIKGIAKEDGVYVPTKEESEAIAGYLEKFGFEAEWETKDGEMEAEDFEEFRKEFREEIHEITLAKKLLNSGKKQISDDVYEMYRNYLKNQEKNA